MFLLASLMLAVFMLWPEQHVSVPPPDIAEYESPPPDLDADEPATALAQSGPLDFVPSEQIGADRAVDFPADI
jgi:hypothetical protein